ncbi:MAG: hypothetical protein ACJ8G7_13510 [Rhizobacter sp.]
MKAVVAIIVLALCGAAQARGRPVNFVLLAPTSSGTAVKVNLPAGPLPLTMDNWSTVEPEKARKLKDANDPFRTPIFRNARPVP